MQTTTSARSMESAHVRGESDVAPSSALLTERATADLLAAFELLTRRGAGLAAWAAPFRDHPIAFLLDSMTDAANLWGGEGELLYQNRAAAALGVGRAEAACSESFSSDGRRFERRCLRCRADAVEYVLEIIHELPHDE